MIIKRIVGLSFLFWLGNSYLFAMNTEITNSKIKESKESKETFKKNYSVWIECGNDCKHKIETLQVNLKKNEIDLKCLNSGIVLTIKKNTIKDWVTIFRKYPLHDDLEFMNCTPIPVWPKKFSDNFNVLQEQYQSKKQKSKKYITLLILCRDSKTE